ncbi:MAG: hypothetical protein U0802_08870 [Candidatus Binatia bacterium]
MRLSSLCVVAILAWSMAARAAMPACLGDCDGDGRVTVDELIRGINVALGNATLATCIAAACDDPAITVEVNCLIGAVNNALSGCPATATPTDTPTRTPTATGVPTGTATATATATPGGPLGVRHFSLDPSSSTFIATLSAGLRFPSAGFLGFLDLAAGVPDPRSGFVLVDVVDASPYLSVRLPNGGAALCLAVDRNQLPVRNAGFLACKGGGAAGLSLRQDRTLGVVDACVGGSQAGSVCADDAQCPDGTCFSAADCAAAGGTVNGPDTASPRVCVGPLVGAGIAADSGPGALLISPDPANGVTQGLPVAVIQERALPCGDEPDATGMSAVFALTTGTARCELVDYNFQDGQSLVVEERGENLSCGEWTRENGPGRLVLAVPSLDAEVNGTPTDIITSFVFDD